MRVDELDDEKRLKFNAMLDEKRSEYSDVVGKKPFMGWDFAQIDRKLMAFYEEREVKLKQEAEELIANSKVTVTP